MLFFLVTILLNLVFLLIFLFCNLWSIHQMYYIYHSFFESNHRIAIFFLTVVELNNESSFLIVSLFGNISSLKYFKNMLLLVFLSTAKHLWFLNIFLIYMKPREWNVVTLAGMLKSITILFSSSSVAFLVKLIASISLGFTFFMSTRYFILIP